MRSLLNGCLIQYKTPLMIKVKIWHSNFKVVQCELQTINQGSMKYLIVCCKQWWVRAELARAIARPEGFSAWLGSWPFFTSARNQKSAENEPKFDSQLKIYFWLIFIITFLNYAVKLYSSYNSTLKTPYLLINDHEIDICANKIW